MALWLEDRAVGQQADELSLCEANPAPLSLVLGAEVIEVWRMDPSEARSRKAL